MAYGTRRLSAAFTKALQYLISWAELVLYSYIRLGIPKGLFPVSLIVKILKVLLPSSILATCSVNLNLRDLIPLIVLGERYKLWSFSLGSLLLLLFAPSGMLSLPHHFLLSALLPAICAMKSYRRQLDVRDPILADGWSQSSGFP